VSRSIALDSVIGLLVLTDQESRDVENLYEGPLGVTAGGSSLVVWLMSADSGEPFARGTATVVVADDDTSGPAPLSRIWSGHLSLPSGWLLLSDWSVEPLERLRVPPGSYNANVWADFGADPVPIHVTLRPLGLL
jgi:hypothetical protein